MVKVLGSVLIVVASTLIGFRIAARYANRSRQLRQFISALKLLETEIFYAATPLPDACRRIAKLSPTPVGAFFRQVAENLMDGQGRTATEVWREALLAMKDELALKESDRSVLIAFGQTLGVSDREDQIKHIHLAIAQLSAEEVSAREEQLKSEKMWRYLGALLGLTLVILLY
jgi:stage III sporulation protein AB